MKLLALLALGCGDHAAASVDAGIDAVPCVAPVPIFGAPMASPVPGAIAVSVGDLDGNNSRDLAVATGDDIVVLFNDSRGTFTPALPLRAEPVAADAVLVADVDNDAHNDVLSWRGGVLRVNRHGPSGEVSFLAAETIPTLIRVTAVFATQLDDAGGADLVITDGASTQLLRGNGGTSFTVTGSVAGDAIGVGDVDGDGNQDVLLLRAGDAVVAFGDGSGAVAEVVDSGALADAFAPGVFAAQRALVVADAAGALALVPESGRTFGAPSSLATQLAGPLQVLDTNADLRVDIAGNGALATQCASGVSAAQPLGIARPVTTRLIDITVDNKPDVVQLDSTGVFVSIQQ